jgi:hypothetical protein
MPVTPKIDARMMACGASAISPHDPSFRDVGVHPYRRCCRDQRLLGHDTMVRLLDHVVEADALTPSARVHSPRGIGNEIELPNVLAQYFGRLTGWGVAF